MERLPWWQLCVLVAIVAFSARLVPVLRGGGLRGIGHYDAAAYFASAAGLVHGRLPYRDFLLLHPPGVVLALAPFAALAALIGDANAMACARLAWMGLGAASSLLVLRILAPLGRWPACCGALFYALFYPAVSIEQTTRLEALGATCLLGAMALLTAPLEGATPSPRMTRTAGALLGISAGVKIWGVVPLAAVVIFGFFTFGLHHAAQLVLGAAVGGSAVCLPFLLAAPAQMWRFVVNDQLHREPNAAGPTVRLLDITGLRLVSRYFGHPLAWCVAGVALFLLAAVLACRVQQSRLALTVLAACLVLLLGSPAWLPHYAGLTAAPIAVMFGAAAETTFAWLGRSGHVLQAVGMVLVIASLVTGAVQLTQTSFGVRFPAAALQPAVRRIPGCVTADDPSVLIAMDVLTPNLDRRCPLTVDLGGYSYDLRHSGSSFVSRNRDRLWQRQALSYLRSGSVTLVVRFSTRFGFSSTTAAIIKSWPTLVRAGRYRVQLPAG